MRDRITAIREQLDNESKVYLKLCGDGAIGRALFAVVSKWRWLNQVL